MKNEYSFEHFKITHKYKIQLLFTELEKIWGNTFGHSWAPYLKKIEQIS